MTRLGFRTRKAEALLAVVLAVVVGVLSPSAAAASGEKLALRLEDAVSYALSHSPQVRLADYRWDSARYAHWEAQRVKSAVESLPEPPPDEEAGVPGLTPYQSALLTKLYPLRAEAGSDVANRARAATRETVSAAVRQAYFACLQAEVGLEVAKAAEDLALRQEEAARLLVQYGMATEKDLLAARARVAQAQAGVAAAESYVRAAKYALCGLLGVGLDTELELTEREFAYQPMSLSAEELEAAADRAARERYEVYAAQRQLELKEGEAEFVEHWGYYGDPGLAQVAGPSPWAEVMAEAAKAAAQAELDLAKLKVRQEVYQAYQELLDAQAAYEASSASVAEAEEGLRAAKEKLAQGAATRLDVQAAEFALLQARANQRKLLYAWCAVREKYQHSKGKGMSLGQQGAVGMASGAAGW